MNSFRSELENPLVEQDIIDLEKKIKMYYEGTIHEDKFRSLRLARGVYGQRQSGVQMVRIKLPFGKMTFRQWSRIADISDEYSNGNLHLTTRQDIQIHYVSLDRTPELWHKLELDQITLREACGNTVRNVTASVSTGIDPNELFDVQAYAQAFFEYFLRNPICQEMGRKIKIAFSNTDEDTALTYMHDLGFIPKIQNGQRGFKVMVGGGLGSQPRLADVAYEFLAEDQIIPFAEAVLRIFDRHGERNSRSKARMKFLIQKIGFETFMELVQQERKANKVKSYPVELLPETQYEIETTSSEIPPNWYEEFQNWLRTNTFEQKQKGLFAIYIRIPLGNISSVTSRKLIEMLRNKVADDVRVTINQSLMLKYVPEANLPYVFLTLKSADLATLGNNSPVKITACPGTDTCNLGISNSTDISLVFEQIMEKEYPQLIYNSDIKIKISGCINSCGQHSMAQIGFHGSSMKAPDKRVMPALQILLGGGTLGDGKGRVADKIIKIPSKRGPQTLRKILDDYIGNAKNNETFNQYYDRLSKTYFYDLLKPLASLDVLENSDYIDWGNTQEFVTEIGVGECAGVLVDLVTTLFFEADEKITEAERALQENRYADAIYLAYSAQVNTAKALLLDLDIHASTQMKVINSFDEQYLPGFEKQILAIHDHEPGQNFAIEYLDIAREFCKSAPAIRKKNQTQK